MPRSFARPGKRRFADQDKRDTYFRSSSADARHANGSFTAPARLMQLQRTVGNRAVQRMVASRLGTGSLLIQRVIPDKIKQDDDIFYRDGMNEAKGRSIIERITQQDATALQDLQGDSLMLDYYNSSPENIFAQEWGLGLDRTDPNGEVVLIAGGKNGVNWAPYLKDLIPLAHSHPFRKDRKIKNDLVLFDDINGVSGTQNISERLRILPSTGDVEFCAYQGIASHTVYTPYAVVTRKSDEKKGIVNPTVERFAGAPRLSFLILNAAQDPTNEQHYVCTLVALEGGAEFWRKDNVLADLTKGQTAELDL